MGTVSADPGRLDAFVTESGDRVDAVTRASGTLQDALDALNAALPSGYGISAAVPTAPLSRVRTLDGGLSEVARRFRVADSGAGVVTVDEGALGQPLPVAYTPEQRQRLAEEAADEYANLAEDDGDPTTRAELAGYLDLIRGEIDAAGEGLSPAEAFEARKRRAAELLAAAGPRDLRAALELIGDDIEDGGTRQERGESTLEDLGIFTSLGLEDDPIRAQEWIDTLEEEWDWDGYHGEDTERGQLLALLATQVDTDTRAFGEVIFWRIFDDPWHPDGDNDLLEAVAGDTSVFTVLFDGLSDSPRLANAIVDRGIGLTASGDDQRAATWDALLDARYDGFENSGSGTGDDSDDARYQNALGDLLTAATSERLLPEERVATALGLLEYLEDHAGNDDHYVRFSGPVREALGRTIDPLLDAWIAGDRTTLAVPGDPPIDLPPEAMDLLQRALDRIAHDTDAARGFTWALTDFVEAQIHAAVQGGGDGDLSQLGIVLQEVVGETSGSRYDALRDVVEGGGATSALESLFSSALGAAPVVGTAAAAVYGALKAYYGNPTGGGDEILPVNFTSFVRTELLLAHIEAGDAGLSPAAQRRLEQAAADGGPTAVEDLLLSDPDFAAVERLIEAEKQRIDPELVEALDGIFAG
ncbi:MAG TPA: hypothetical protein VK507_23890 [Iamia sp.]|nr:hypothetical protein [Iamia sp.]